MELQPCPFCGSTDLEVDDDDETSSVECEKCKIMGPVGDDLEEVIKLWNKRISTPPYLDETHPHFSKEVPIAISAWIAMFENGGYSTKKPPKQQIAEWLKINYKDLTNNAIKRISTLVNTNKGKKGGATPTEPATNDKSA